jgi:DNA-binding XRE family transcriptional regulator
MDFPVQPIPIPALRAARAAFGLKQNELAKLAGVSPRTVFKIEKEGDAKLESILLVQKAFERLGVTFSLNKRTGRVLIELPPAVASSESAKGTKAHTERS